MKRGCLVGKNLHNLRFRLRKRQHASFAAHVDLGEVAGGDNKSQWQFKPPAIDSC